MSKRFCYYVNPVQDPADHGGYVPSMVTEGEPGHCPLTGDPKKLQSAWVWGKTLEEAEAVCDSQNEKLGITKVEAFKIVGSSMVIA